ncbi:MAG: ATP-binding protein [Myxococcales bacterium]|nr:ATP-binding protein [Myxococcales bacterium]
MEGYHAINFYWLIRLRWWAMFGQAMVVFAAAYRLELQLPLSQLGALMGTSLAINGVSSVWEYRGGGVHPWAVPIVSAVDVLLLTGLLYFSGGPSNPFASLYVVHIALAAVVLPPVQTWGLVGLALVCLSLLSLYHWPLAISDHVTVLGTHWRFVGTWLSFLVAAVFIVYFVQRVTVALSQRESELARARELSVRSEKLASLATLAAGAAHELSTPLSTIAVVAKELERLLMKENAPDHAVEDARLIRKQVMRCRSILSQMAADAGDASGERARPVSAEQLMQLAQEGLPQTERLKFTYGSGVTLVQALLPARAISQAFRSLIKNALQASGATVEIVVSLSDKGQSWTIEISDQGKGMSEEVLSRAGDPFFTTKEPGEGMGLGLFLTRAVLERFGGQLELRSTEGAGTLAVVVLPLESDPEPLHVPYEPMAHPAFLDEHREGRL